MAADFDNSDPEKRILNTTTSGGGHSFSQNQNCLRIICKPFRIAQTKMFREWSERFKLKLIARGMNFQSQSNVRRSIEIASIESEQILEIKGRKWWERQPETLTKLEGSQRTRGRRSNTQRDEQRHKGTERNRKERSETERTRPPKARPGTPKPGQVCKNVKT